MCSQQTDFTNTCWQKATCPWNLLLIVELCTDLRQGWWTTWICLEWECQTWEAWWGRERAFSWCRDAKFDVRETMRWEWAGHRRWWAWCNLQCILDEDVQKNWWVWILLFVFHSWFYILQETTWSWFLDKTINLDRRQVQSHAITCNRSKCGYLINVDPFSFNFRNEDVQRRWTKCRQHEGRHALHGKGPDASHRTRLGWQVGTTGRVVCGVFALWGAMNPMMGMQPNMQMPEALVESFFPTGLMAEREQVCIIQNGMMSSSKEFS